MRNKETKLKNKVTRKWQRDQEEFEYFVHDPSYMEHQAMTRVKLKGEAGVINVKNRFILQLNAEFVKSRRKKPPGEDIKVSLSWWKRKREERDLFLYSFPRLKSR